MKPSFLKFAIGLCALSFIINVIVPIVLIATNNWRTDWSWIPFFGNLPLLFCFIYVTYKFYYFKKVRVLFFLDFIQFLFSLVSFYTAFLRKIANEPAVYDEPAIYAIYGMGIIIAIATLVSPLRKEPLFLVFSAGNILIRTTQLIGLVLHSLPLLSLAYLVATVFQLIWIPIFYRELNLTRKDELLDQ